ncbi:MAG TPA: type I-D CRISPR-associated protein Cas10d/Csc3 [candidate division WOR-3 bacterium]|uniref:Type I-D CRISPR-associated protein Cas10d/Csc3 n=1 Tax=candidate division WOR-3 bacterium TaxID=2052148 RepID=A0A9C9K0L1_UNCW3|nr:type I-D CRISPR-associated protein Cas10d/Csc3 [candidate division WOR-3 bacterium]
MAGFIVSKYRAQLLRLFKARGWQNKIGKTFPFNQTLLEHSLITYDVVEKLLDLLREKKVFSNEEEKVLLISAIAHDVGKEKDEWQKAVKENRKPPKHIDDDLIQEIVGQLSNIFGIKDINSVIDAIKFHMSSTKTDGNIISSVIAKHKTEKWKDISNIIASVDNLVSCSSPLEAYILLNNPSRFSLSKYFYSTYYQINIRGVSSTFLHKACQESYEKKGWTPLLYFPEGTIYVSLREKNNPTSNEIIDRLKNLVENKIKTDVINGVVPHVIMDNKPIPRPELFDYSEYKTYLEKVRGRRNPSEFQKFLKKFMSNKWKESLSKFQDNMDKPDVRKILESYIYFSVWKEEEKVITKNKIKKDKNIDEKVKTLKKDNNGNLLNQIKDYCYRIIECQDEVALFKFFKASIDKEIWGIDIKDEVKSIYNSIFGEGNFEKLMSMSNNDYPHEFAYSVIPFWKLKTVEILDKLKDKSLSRDLVVKNLDKKKRLDILRGLLNWIWQRVDIRHKPERRISEKMAKDFTEDIVYPLREKINSVEELKYYKKSKLNTKKETGIHLCPICNRFFDRGKKTTSDIVDNPEAFTNRAVCHGKAGKIVICEACRSEIYLRQILTKINGPLDKTIYLFPQFNFSQQLGKQFIDKVFRIKQRAESLMSGLTDNPELRMDLSKTYNIAQNVLQYFDDIDTKNLEDLVITKQKEEKIDKALTDELIKYFEEENLPIKGKEKDYNKALEIINREWGENYKNWHDFWNDLRNNRIELAREVVKRAYKIRETYKIIAQTANVVIVPLINPIKWGNEAEVNGAFRELFISIILALKLNCAVAITDKINKIDITQRRGLVYVPENHLIRQIVGDEWIRDYDYINSKGKLIYSAKKWLKAIASAIILTLKTAYSDRTGLFEILTARTEGHILRRIEMQDEKNKKAGKRTNYAGHIETYNLIENTKEVLQ